MPNNNTTEHSEPTWDGISPRWRQLIPTTTTCHRCGERCDQRWLTRTISGVDQRWCRDCADNHSACCRDCGDRHESVRHYLYPNFTCESCEDNYFTCDSCGERLHNDHYGEDGYCFRCVRAQREDENESGAPTHKLGKGPHYYGVELEVEMNDDGSGAALKQDMAYSKLGRNNVDIRNDGSLDYGFEIVTCPASLDEQKKLWKAYLEPRPTGLKSFKTRTCGLHVHCSRKPLSQLTIAKVVCFTNAAHNRRFMAVVAGRASGQWANYKAKAKLSDGVKCNPQRYEAVNLQNRHTIEFRIFKGTLKYASVCKAIEFCDALIHYCDKAGRSIQDSQSRVLFLEYVEKNKRTYPYLYAFVEAKWFGRESEQTIAAGYRAVENSEEEENQLNEE